MIKSWTREGIHKVKKVLVEKRLGMMSINLNYMCISCHVLILSSQNDIIPFLHVCKWFKRFKCLYSISWFNILLTCNEFFLRHKLSSNTKKNIANQMC